MQKKLIEYLFARSGVSKKRPGNQVSRDIGEVNYQLLEPRQLLAANLLVNGDFEIGDGFDGLQTSADVVGWNSTTDGNGKRILDVIEQSRGNFLKIDSQDGRFDRVYQDVKVSAGQDYLLSFDILGEGDGNTRADELRVLWDKQLVGVFRGVSKWQTVGLTVSGTQDDLARLEFRETYSEHGGDGVGPYIDNITLVPASLDEFPNGSFEEGNFSPENSSTRIHRLDHWFTNGPSQERDVSIRHYGSDDDGQRGDYYWNVDSNFRYDRLFHPVETQADKEYVVLLDMRSSQVSTENSNQLRVRWNGRWVSTLLPSQNWQTFSVQVRGEKSGTSWLDLREAFDRDANFGDGQGPWVDNVRIYELESSVAVEQISPANGEELVSVTRETIVRFDGKVDPETVTDETFYVIANSQKIPGRVVVSSTGKFATYFYDEPLPAATEVRVMVDGDRIRGRNGLPIDANVNGVSGGLGTADFSTLPLTRIPNTNVFGYVRDSVTGDPLVGVTIKVDAIPGLEIVTIADDPATEEVDEAGRFELTDVPAPDFFVTIDGSTVTGTPSDTMYPTLGKPFHSLPGTTTQLSMDGEVFDIFLPLMSLGDIQDLSSIDSTEIGFGEAGKNELARLFPNVNPAMFNMMKVTFEPGSARDDFGNVATQAVVIPVAPDRIPAPLPATLNPSLVISVQAGIDGNFNGAGGATNFDVPAQVSFPNIEEMAAGEKMLLMSFDHDVGEWVVNGTATVSDDGMSVVSDPSTGIVAPGWHFVISGSPAIFEVGRNSGSNNNRLGADEDFDMSNGLFKRIDDAIPAFAPVRAVSHLLIRGCYTAATFARGADFDIVQEYYERFLSGEGGRIEADSSVLSLVGDHEVVKENVRRYKPIVEDAITQAIVRSIDRENGTLNLNDVRDSLVSILDVPIDTVDLGKNGGSLQIIIDNTQAATLSIESLAANGRINSPETGGVGEWTANLVYTLSDDFGFDSEDAERQLDESKNLLFQAAEALKNGEFLTASSLAIDAVELAAASGCLGLIRLEQLFGYAKPFIVDLPVRETSDANGTMLSGTFTIPSGFEDIVIIDGNESSQNPAETQLNRSIPMGLPINADVSNTINLPITSAAGFGVSDQVYYHFSFESGRELRGVMLSGLQVGDLVLEPGQEFVATFYRAKDNSSIQTAGNVSQSGGITVVTPSRFGESDSLSSISLSSFGGVDIDGDGIPDIGEKAIGTNPNNIDSDGDGISDSAELEQGLNPLDGIAATTGVQASLELPGDVEAIAAVDNLAYAATGDHGLAIVDVSSFRLPIQLGQIELAGVASDVGVDSELGIAAVASGTTLQLVDVSDPMMPELIRSVNVAATLVEVSGGYAFATAGSGLQVIDLSSGSVVGSLVVPDSGTVTSLERKGNLLYGFVSGPNILAIVDISQPETPTFVSQFAAAVPVSDVGISVGNDNVWIAGGGLGTIDISDPSNPVLINGGDAFFNAKRIGRNGSGLGLVLANGGDFVQVYDTSDPEDTDALLTQFDLSNTANSITISNGFAFIGAGNRFEVVNFLPFDAEGLVPSAEIEIGVEDVDQENAGIQVIEGSLIPIEAKVLDDVQVRSVELLLDGNVIASDVSFPFDFLVRAPAISSGEFAEYSVRATDTGGNRVVSEVIRLEFAPDTFAPVVVFVSPTDGSELFEGSRTARVRFNEAVSDESVTNSNFQIIAAGNNGVLGDADDLIVPLELELKDGGRLVELRTNEGLRPGLFQLQVDESGVTDLFGNLLGAGLLVNRFEVKEVDSAPEFLPFGSAIQLGNLQDDESFQIADLPFEFEFFGENVGSEMFVTTNGVILFGEDTLGSVYNNFELPANHVGAFPLFDDLHPGVGANPRIGLFDGEGFRVVSFLGIPHFRDNSVVVSFQIAFLENGTIHMRYGDMDTMLGDGSATIGLTNGIDSSVPSLGNIVNKLEIGVTDENGLLDNDGLAILDEVFEGNDILVFIPNEEGGYDISLNP